ncbi:MAG: hypothetical protein FWF51_07615 [Chitinivibrionia bacterium]|nr:hypothetical protein [Chitinivibrionia bacterium]
MIKHKLAIFFAFLAAASVFGGGVSYPSATIPAARFASGVSYDYIGGYLTLNSSTDPTPAYSLYGANIFFTYGLADFINAGVDLGLKDANIHSSDPSFVFNGRMGAAAGTHVKLSTSYMGDVFAIVLFSRFHFFYSEDKGRNEYNRGRDITASGAFSFHVKEFGYITMGAKYLDITAKIYGKPAPPEFKNDALVGGWVAFDYFPKTAIKTYLPFVSFELGFFPNSERKVLEKKPVFRNISFSVTIGGITNRLYGNSDDGWRP